ncbi:MAG: hypothetical protein E6J90_15910 [Deltaproteobacteria bacterium]|nr:MAG: hypothetical protein E6J91_12380 [Deltaproteobacteria bacterium]TMQ20590.1 MAG: hypothetical protein E6J90_15910 [Deltaproteobacteria bacterium]
MGDFAIVGEGVTDQIVLKNVLLGYYRDRDPEPLIVFEQPPLDATGTAGSPYAHGGWTLVVRYLSQGSYRQALQFNRYVVIQIDTDIAGDLGVVRMDGLSDEDFIELIVGKLGSYIAEEDRALVRDRLLFAIGFDEIECWLLPLVFDRSEKTSLAKTTGCLEAINHKLHKSNETPLSTQGGSKDPRRYERVSAPFRRRKHFEEAAINAGFARFQRALDGCVLDEPAAD